MSLNQVHGALQQMQSFDYGDSGVKHSSHLVQAPQAGGAPRQKDLNRQDSSISHLVPQQ